MSSTSQPTLGQVATKILEDALQRIIHDVVIQKHHEHRMLLNSLDPTTKLPHCETCKLPKVLDPPLAPSVRGAASDPPANTNYCDLKPWSRRPGHDIYGNPFLKSEAGGRPLSKKEREKKKEEGTPASEGANNEAGGEGTGPPSPSQENENQESQGKGKLEKGEKKASKIDEKLKKGEYIPWHTCPSCKRSLLITRFAKHLEQCMGLSGRAASRNAMAKMNGTPSGSRGGTPNPSQDGTAGGKENGAGAGGNGDGEDDDLAVKGPGGVRKKLLTQGLKDKVKKGEKAGAGTNGIIPKSLKPANNPTNSAGGTQRSSPAPSSVGGDKRDRDELGDDDADDIHIKKRQKLQRVGSTASILSQSTTAPTEMERQDSLDGSFVNDDGDAGED